ncbi:DUF397 domain-containing protein [Streptomyces sp. S465]|uniref:DUF397 domain-containing protein n=1 Tax=Streptomyces sp. S465 TaxID=2979468 RepID=UPI0022A81D6A|nr:DUF397 domain-containing protein [Streptomyces sp. S465]WAP57727.1 DUF397 domain-containing protein [Streptomyces sp. S465]
MTPEVIGPYIKSSYSGQNNNCLEIAATSDGGRAVRDSKNPDGPSLRFTGTEWHAFLRGVERGVFDD